MKKLYAFPLLFALLIVATIQTSVHAFPGVIFDGQASASNVNVDLRVLNGLPINSIVADIAVGSSASTVKGTAPFDISTTSDVFGASVTGQVLILPVDQTVVQASTEKIYGDNSSPNPNQDSNNSSQDIPPLLNLGVANNSATSVLRNAAGQPDETDPTNALSMGTAQTADISIGLTAPISPVLSTNAVTATTTTETVDANSTLLQGRDAVSCVAQSDTVDLSLLGLVSADSITTRATGLVNGYTDDALAEAEVTFVNLTIGDDDLGTFTNGIGSPSLPPISLLNGDVSVTVAPELTATVGAELVTVNVTALRLEIVADALGLSAGSVIEVGFSDINCAATRGNANPTDDSDGDGVNDLDDLDDDNDGIPDSLEGDRSFDTDSDGIPDSLDLDSDNDGINDVLEAGHADSDGDGDGRVDGAAGANGLSDSVEESADSGTINYTLRDTDGDNVPDVRDLDSDNDGIADVVENGNAAADPDGNGMIEGADEDFDGISLPADGSASYGDAGSGTLLDADGDGVPNVNDLDSDNDGVTDINEAGLGDFDTDGDGVANGSDSDSDGIVGGLDNAPSVYGNDNGALPDDTDNDNVPDSYDLDSDNDSITDIVESGNGAADANGDGIADGNDTDGDGIQSSVDGLPDDFGTANQNELPDSDDDDIPDMQELDSDNDGDFDIDEAGNGDSDANNDGMADGGDDDGDGIPESVDTNPDDFGNMPTSTPTAVSLRESQIATGFSYPDWAIALILVTAVTLALNQRGYRKD